MQIPAIQRLGHAAGPVRGELSFAMIATADIAQHLVRRLTARDFEGTQIQDLLGERDLSLNEATAILGQRIGKPQLGYLQLPGDRAIQALVEIGVSYHVATLFVEMSKGLNDGLFCVDRPRTPGSTTPTSIEAFAGTFATAFAAASMGEAL
jgi:uncharacterized protein YbjT (DUF2867 family)